MGDLNGDGNLDIVAAVSATDGVVVFFGNGDGTFQPKIQIPVTLKFHATGVVITDLNRDGKLDLAVASQGHISVLIGNGDGTFQSSTEYETGVDGTGPIIAVDLNGDSYPDFAFLGFSGNDVSVLINKPDGRFGLSRVAWGVTYEPSSLAAGDFTGDGKQDLAIGGLSAVTILANRTPGP